MKEPFSMIIRDATIQRFEYTFEALWKFLKEYLKEKEGIVSNSPKACFKNNPCLWKERNSLFTAFIRIKCAFIWSVLH